MLASVPTLSLHHLHDILKQICVIQNFLVSSQLILLSLVIRPSMFVSNMHVARDYLCAECWRLKYMVVRHFSTMIILIVTRTLLSSQTESSTWVTGKGLFPDELLLGFPGLVTL